MNSIGSRTAASAYLLLKLAKWRVSAFFGSKYWYGKLRRLFKLLNTNKELSRKRTGALAYLWVKLRYSVQDPNYGILLLDWETHVILAFGFDL